MGCNLVPPSIIRVYCDFLWYCVVVSLRKWFSFRSSTSTRTASRTSNIRGERIRFMRMIVTSLDWIICTFSRNGYTSLMLVAVLKAVPKFVQHHPLSCLTLNPILKSVSIVIYLAEVCVSPKLPSPWEQRASCFHVLSLGILIWETSKVEARRDVCYDTRPLCPS